MLGKNHRRLALLTIALLGPVVSHAAENGQDQWPFVGGSLHNMRSAETERAIGPQNAPQLAPDWSLQLKGAVKSATAVSDGDALFVPTATGLIYKIDRKSGQVVSVIDLSALTEIAGAFSKGSLGVSGNLLVAGIQNKPVVVGLDKNTGALLWQVTIDDHPGAVVTQSPIIVDGHVFIGVSGLGEEVQATYAAYPCCSFRGSEVALDAKTGKLLWKTHTIPQGYAGASVWSNAAVYDEKRHSLYITTGNEFHVPDDVQRCADKNRQDPKALAACYAPDVWYDSILALDPDTGRIKWGRRFDDYDIFTGACLVPENHAEAHCGNGEDFDFGNGAMLWHQDGPNGGRDLVGAGQKSGMFWAVDPDNGKIVWQQHLGPGGPGGGVEFGSATDGKRVYAAESNNKGVGHDAAPYTLPSGQTITAGSFAAMDGATGKIIWQVADPAGVKFPGNDKPCKVDSPKEDCLGAHPRAAVTVANGVVYGCSEEPEGHMYAFDAATGSLLWSYASGTRCSTGASIIGGRIYWASGQTLHAFTPNGKDVHIDSPPDTRPHSAVTTLSGIYPPGQAEQGRAIYLRSCATGCHQANLAGSGAAADLAGQGFLSRWTGLSVGDLFKKIQTTMPKTAPGSLSGSDYLAITAYILSANGYPSGIQPLIGDATTLDGIKIAAKK